MTNQQKILELQNTIRETLTPLITSDYVFLDLPYFSNVGDVLIWQGTLDFLKTLPYKCLYSSSIENFRQPKIDENVIILFMGGGNFGDLWYRHQIFREKILRLYPDNHIIQLPQSIHFKDEKVLIETAEVFARHKHLTMCFRDKNSLNIANRYFPSSNNLLVPDMAFFINMNQWVKYINQPKRNKILFLDRKDSEKNVNQHYETVPSEAENRDWVTMEKTAWGITCLKIIQSKLLKLKAHSFNNLISNFVYKNILRKYYIRSGIKFLSGYSYTYTTRLHAAILLILLDKEFTWFDNSYGKNRGVYEAWLSDVDSIKFAEND